MKLFTLPLLSVGSMLLFLSGCSTFVTDHSDDYQKENPLTASLVVPAGSLESKDMLVIPNEREIDSLSETKKFVTPRAPFVFYPMVSVGIAERDDAIELVVPANRVQSQRIVSDFLTALYGAGMAISEKSTDTITSVPFDFHPQGWWASLWSGITRIPPVQTAFSFHFSELDNKTLLSVQFRDEQEGGEASNWMSPTQNDDAYAVTVRLWGAIGRQLKQTSAYLSSQGDQSSFPIWIDHRGRFAIHLGDTISSADVDAKLSDAGLYIIPGDEPLLSPVPPEDIARIGDVVDFNLPVGNGESLKLFSVYRKNLDDAEWDERSYPYKIYHQKAGDFLVIDVSAVEFPELISFRLAQRFVN
ncbi:hypothetical protein [Marinomonas sp. IMCC 4694]|uniref:hypothetical protein n=1 Tax=Marinomonas sp. IMCC 4694 TaxID=2605432 RepID=UPI0011E89B2B|nr:hypothetical protein [Marinomonas sp. IMCC 4694]TYL47756.1 hypothetical protein FXV75_07275 [Marinomonas sp. IMCC 4694]